MTLDQYNEAVKQVLAEQQARQWSLIQQMAKLNTEMMLGIMGPKL